MDADKSVNRWVTFEVVDYSQTLSNVSKPILLLCRSVILRTKFGLKCFFPFLQASKSVSLISSTKHNFLSLESSLLLSYIRSAIQVNDSFNFLWIGCFNIKVSQRLLEPAHLQSNSISQAKIYIASA